MLSANPQDLPWLEEGQHSLDRKRGPRADKGEPPRREEWTTDRYEKKQLAPQILQAKPRNTTYAKEKKRTKNLKNMTNYLT